MAPTCTAGGLESIKSSDRNGPIRHTIFITTLCLSMVVLAVWLMIYLRYQWRTETIYRSAAKNEGSMQVTQHYAGVSETENLSGPLELTHSIPPTGNTIHNVRQRVVHRIHDGEAAIKSKISLRPSIASSSTSTLFNEDGRAKESEHSAVFGGGTAAMKALHEKAEVKPNWHPHLQMGNTPADLVTNDPASVGDALKGTLFDLSL